MNVSQVLVMRMLCAATQLGPSHVPAIEGTLVMDCHALVGITICIHFITIPMP